MNPGDPLDKPAASPATASAVSAAPLVSVELATGDRTVVWRRTFGQGEPRIAIVAGVRGDTPEGIRVAHTVCTELHKAAPRLRGTVEVFPCLNPLAAHLGLRRWPSFDLDLNRRFPGRADGHAPDQVAAALLHALTGTLQVIELRGAHPAFREETQAHVSADAPDAMERARHTNVAMVWCRTPIRSEGTLAAHVPGLIQLEGGSGNRLYDRVGRELSDGVLNLLCRLGVLPDDDLPFHWAAIQRPRVVGDADVHRARAERGGLFMPVGRVGAEVEVGDPLGDVVDPASGEHHETVTAPVSGRLMALREQPVVYPGSLVARVVA